MAAEGPGAMTTIWLEGLDVQQPQQQQQQQHVKMRMNKIGPAITAILAGRANSYHHAKIPKSCKDQSILDEPTQQHKMILLP